MAVAFADGAAVTGSIRGGLIAAFNAAFNAAVFHGVGQHLEGLASATQRLIDPRPGSRTTIAPNGAFAGTRTGIAPRNTRPMPTTRIAATLELLRPHQWAKNALVFVALFTSHSIADADRWIAAIAMFIAFSLAASAIYVINDALDVAHDRAHPDKRQRPFARGALPVAMAWWLAPLLFALAALTAIVAVRPGWPALAGYVVLALGYALWLKRKLWLDVVALAGLYALRVAAGALAIGVVISPWLLAFSGFLFFSLAAVKRYADLSRADVDPIGSGRAYLAADLGTVHGFGVGAAVAAIVVLALYAYSADGERLYTRPEWLFGLCPLLLYWLARLWTLAARGAIRIDPVLFALRDRVSWLVLAPALATVALAL